MPNVCQSAAYGDSFWEDACSFPPKMGTVCMYPVLMQKESVKVILCAVNTMIQTENPKSVFWKYS